VTAFDIGFADKYKKNCTNGCV